MLPPYTKFPLHCVNFIDLDKWRRTWMPFICHITWNRFWYCCMLQPSCCASFSWWVYTLPQFSRFSLSLSHCVCRLYLCLHSAFSRSIFVRNFRVSQQMYDEFISFGTAKKWDGAVNSICFGSFCAWWHKYPFDLIFNHIIYIVFHFGLWALHDTHIHAGK